jgi:ATP-dependent Lon protease
VLQLLKLPDGTVKVLVEGGGARQDRRLMSPTRTFFEAEAEMPGRGPRQEGRGRGAGPLGHQRVRELCEAQQEDLARDRGGTVSQIDEPSKLADTVASHLAVKIADRRPCWKSPRSPHRLEKVLSLMESEMSVLQVEKRIRSRVKRQMEKTQREYYLNEQMKAIQKELGDGEEGRDEAGRAGGAHRAPSSPRRPATRPSPK